MTIKSPADFGLALKIPYAWPGGYPTFFITEDGAALCHKCAKREGQRIISSIRDGANADWRVVAMEINWEDTDCYCDHCSKQIESAYGESVVS